MESKELSAAHMASAPSYDEAMKCSTVPPSQMLNPYPSNMLQQHPAPTVQPYPVAHNYPPQPMAQPQVMVMVQPAAAPAPAPQLLQSSHELRERKISIFPFKFSFRYAAINIGGGQATCQSCRKPLRTRIDYHSTCCTHLTFLLCCIFG